MIHHRDTPYRITITILLLLFLFTGNLMAQSTGVIKGKVTNTEGAPIESINISLQGTHYGTATDETGTYRLESITPGQYTLLASSVGHENVRKQITVETGQATVVDFTLTVATEELDELTVTGDAESKYDASETSASLKFTTPILQAPQNIQVVTSDLLADQQIFNMVEGVTRNVSGVHRAAHWDNLYARIYSRGSKIPGFRNGMNAELNWGPLSEDMSMVERIEFVKGPAGFMMANGEPGGFYNVVTKKPTEQTRASATLTAGSFNTLRATADFDGNVTKDNTLQYRLNVMGQQKDSFRKFDYNNRYALAPVLTYNLDNQTSLTLEYTYQYSEYQQPGGYVSSPDGYATLPRDFTVNDPKLDGSRIHDHSLFTYLNHQFNDQWKLTAKLSYFDYDILGQYVYPRNIDSEGNVVRPVTVWDMEANMKMGQVYLNGKVATGPVEHHILAGLDLSDKQYIAVFPTIGSLPDLNIYDPQYNVPTDSIPEYNPSRSLNTRAGTYRTNLFHTAYYLQDELHFWDDNVRLTLAGRYTESNTDDVKENVFTPRLGLSVSLDENTSVYTLYDQTYLPQAGQNAEGDSFDPVEGYNIEAGLKRQWLDGKWNSTITAYQITKQNILTTDPNNAEFSIQRGESRTRGIEADLKGRLLPGLDLVVNYAFTDSEITEDTDESIVGTPTPGNIRHLNSGWLSYRLPETTVLGGLGFSLGYQWKVDRTPWSNVQASLDHPQKDYFRLDGAISWENDHLNLSLNINNILDEYLYQGGYSSYYETYIWISEPPRNFRLSMKYKF